MNKHIVQHWWKYIFVAIVGLLGYYYLAPVLQDSALLQNNAPEKSNDGENTQVNTDREVTTEQDTNEEINNTEDTMSEEYTTTNSGLQYKIISEGEGGEKPGPTSQVEVHYHGTLPNGTVFDSSRERGQTISFGLNQVIPGWTEGLQLMSVGDVYEFYIPSHLAYGDRSPSPLIPAGSDLVFEVELFAVSN